MVTKTALEKLKKKDLVQAVLDIQKERMAILGEGECFVRKDGDGFTESIKVNVTLRESKKEIYSLGEKWCISADGYDRLNQAAGLSVVAPKTILASGALASNPHFEFGDDKNLKSVTVRRIVMGPAPIGNLVAIERILRFDVDLYFIEDLQFKVSSRAGAGGYGTKDVKPNQLKDKSSVVAFPVGPAVLWVDVSHVDIQDAFRSHIHRCKFAERMAIRMCERNCFASHPAIARRNVEPVEGVATVAVFGGRFVVDQKRIKELMTRFVEGDFEDMPSVELVQATDIDKPTLKDVDNVSLEDELSPDSKKKVAK